MPRAQTEKNPARSYDTDSPLGIYYSGIGSFVVK